MMKINKFFWSMIGFYLIFTLVTSNKIHKVLFFILSLIWLGLLWFGLNNIKSNSSITSKENNKNGN